MNNNLENETEEELLSGLMNALTEENRNNVEDYCAFLEKRNICGKGDIETALNDLIKYGAFIYSKTNDGKRVFFGFNTPDEQGYNVFFQ